MGRLLTLAVEGLGGKYGLVAVVIGLVLCAAVGALKKRSDDEDPGGE